MAEDKKPEDTKTESTALSLKDLKKFVQDSVTELVKGGTNVKDGVKDEGTKNTDGTPSIADEVNRQVQAIRDREARDNRDKELDTKLADLGKKLEVTPVERGRLHKFMGWGE